MNQSRIYITLSVLGIFLAIGIVLQKKVPREEWNQFFTEGTFPKSLTPAPSERRVSPSHAGEDGEETSEVYAIPEVSEDVKDWNELLTHLDGIPRLKSVPWETTEIEEILKSFRAGSCQLLPPNTDVFPLPVEIGEITNPIMNFRKGSIIVGLAMDPAAQRQLPKLSKGEIEGYLARHMLTLQATIFRNREGQVSFAGPVNAAFVAKSAPRTTIAPEKMIQDAIGRIKLLGILSENESLEDKSARTLVFSFAYERDMQGTGIVPLTTTDYELFFLHLIKDEAAIFTEPSIITFATTEGRKNFVEIKPSETAPNITASIRFNDFKLMGLYPANPVVTAVKSQSVFSALVDDIRNRLRGDIGLPPITLSQLLDEIHQSAGTAGRTRR